MNQPKRHAGTLLMAVIIAGAPAAWAGSHHAFSEAFFRLFLDGKEMPNHVVLAASARTDSSGRCVVDAQAAFLSDDPVRQGTRLVLRSFSTRDTSITGARIAGDTLTFDLHLDGRDADRKIRIRSVRDPETGVHQISGSGLWSDQTHTSFVRARWRQIERINLAFPAIGPVTPPR